MHRPILTAVVRQRSALRRRGRSLVVWLSVAVVGCGSPPREVLKPYRLETSDYYRQLAKQVDYADPQLHACQRELSLPPFSIERNAPSEYWDLSLHEAIFMALGNSPVLRDLGGTVLRTPANVPTIHNPAIVETDPRFGVENALSGFDAQLSSRLFYQFNDRALNNTFFGGGTRLLEQNLGTMVTTVSKETTQGTQFFARHNTTYDANNAPGNLFYSAWDTNYEVEFRHPLLAGSGVEFNRIVGVNGQPGLFSGVVLARINTDISLAEFETAVRNMVADVENAYWDLYAAYRDLQSKVAARDGALEIWRRTHALFVADKRGGEADKEAYAREQYYRFQEEVETALSGVVTDGTRTNNGSPAGTFRGPPGVQLAERRLRLVIGLPPTDGRLIRPADEPTVVRVAFDWNQTMHEALARRPELRRQRWLVKRREMELSATRNYLLPQLDVSGIYRWRGFGDDLFDTGKPPGRFNNAYQNLMDGQFQEYQLGAELTVPIGFRKAHNMVRNAQIQLARDRAILHEQERNVSHDLSNAVADVERSYVAVQTTYNRLFAARDQLSAVQSQYDADKAPLDMLLESQRRFLEAETRYHRALVAFALALRNVHFEKGTSLEYHDIFLQDSPTHTAHGMGRAAPGPINYAFEEVPPGPTAASAPTPPVLSSPAIDASAPAATPEPVLPPPMVTPSTPKPKEPASPNDAERGDGSWNNPASPPGSPPPSFDYSGGGPLFGQPPTMGGATMPRPDPGTFTR